MLTNTQDTVKNQRIYPTWLMLKITYGIIPIVAGADKFLNLIAPWQHYMSPQLAALIPLDLLHIMYIVGVIEIVAGVIVLSSYTRYGAYIVAGWLMALVLNLIALGYFDIAIRDVVMAIGAIALAQLTALIETR